jgi:ABC-2 type transport system permease protein
MKKLFYFFKVSFEKSLKDFTRYKFNTIMEFATFYILFMTMFLGLNFFGQNMEASPLKLGNTLENLIVGYFIWTIMLVAYSSVAYGISSDATKGTLEQICMSSLGLHSVVIVRSIANLFINIVLCFILLVFIMMTTGYWLSLDVISLTVVILIGIFSIFGISLILGGLAVIFKQINSFLNIVQFLLISLILFDMSPLVSVLLPFRPAINMVYDITREGFNLLSFSILDYICLILNSAIYFIIGLIIFNYCGKIAKKKGLLGQY